jgi:RNA polymerase-binding protein DksA
MSSIGTNDVFARVHDDRVFLRLAKLRLVAEREALRADVSVPAASYERQATTGYGETDHINVQTERQLKSVLDDHARRALEDVESALARIDDGTYGRCTRCGVTINPERLAALPRVACCIDCQRRDGER